MKPEASEFYCNIPYYHFSVFITTLLNVTYLHEGSINFVFVVIGVFSLFLEVMVTLDIIKKTYPLHYLVWNNDYEGLTNALKENRVSWFAKSIYLKKSHTSCFHSWAAWEPRREPPSCFSARKKSSCIVMAPIWRKALMRSGKLIIASNATKVRPQRRGITASAMKREVTISAPDGTHVKKAKIWGFI